MALSAEQAEQLVEDLSAIRAKLHAIVHGADDATVETDGGTVKTVAKVIADADALLQEHAEDLAQVISTVEGYVAEAEAWAEAPEDDEVEAGKYSARHWAAKAQAVRDSLGDVMVFRGAFDASTGSYPSNPVQGDLYTVTVSGTVGGTALVAGDEIIYGPSGWIFVGRHRSAGEIVALITGNFTDGAHGPRGGGALHAIATTSVAGFMSAADKSYLDGLPAALGAKANASDVAVALAEKADASAVTSALAEKADTSAVASALADKADTSALSEKLDKEDPAVEGVLHLDDGSLSEPALAFSSDAATGLYLTAGGALVVVVGGVERLRIDGDGIKVTGMVAATGEVEGFSE